MEQSGDKGQRSQPPPDTFQRFAELTARDIQAAQAWEDREGGTLLTQRALTAGWTEAEIGKLLEEHNRRHGNGQSRAPEATLRVERQKASQRDLLVKLRALIEPRSPAPDDDGERAADTEQADRTRFRAELLSTISQIAGIPVDRSLTRAVRYLSDPPCYQLDAGKSHLRLNGVDQLIQQSKFRLRIGDLCGHVIRDRFSPTDWQDIAQALLSACEDVEVGEESTDAGLVNSWLGAYFGFYTILDSLDVEDDTRSPFLHQGRVHVYIDHFRRFIAKRGDRLDMRELSILLRRAGAKPVKLQGRAKSDWKGVRSVRVWQLPKTEGEADEVAFDA
ncbi:MAG: hypothetical protein M1482_13680 [Chloroflexi bacterium]|nr:hypothetical protein [Chloroflexota bacterium]